MRLNLWWVGVVLLPLAGRAVTVESAPWGSFTLDTRSQNQCLTVIGSAGVTAGRGLWDVTGTYAATVDGFPLQLDLVHDTNGKLTGNATLALNTGKALVPVTMPIRGSSQGAAGSLALTLTMQGADVASAVRGALTCRLALDPATRQLSGTVSGSRSVGGMTTPISAQPLALALPGSMDGTWALQFDLVWGDKGVRGTARLSLSNGVVYGHTVSGKYADQAAVLTLSGRPAYPMAVGGTLRTTLAPLEGAATQMTAFSGTLYGQTVAW